MQVGDKVKVYMTSENVEEGVCPATYAAACVKHNGGKIGSVFEISKISPGYAVVLFPAGYMMMKMEQLEVISENR
jgi:hypothetical protein